MLADLKIRDSYDGFLFLAESVRNPPRLDIHHHVELELNLIVRGSVTYVVAGRRYTFPQGELLWLFPAQEHQLVDRTDDAQYYVAVFKPELIDRSCSGDRYSALMRPNTVDGHVLHTLLAPGPYDLIRRIMDGLMEEALDPDLLNQELGYGFESDFRYEHGDPDGLNAGLHHLLLLCWRQQHSNRPLRRAVDLHPAVLKAIEHLSGGEWEETLASLASRCGISEAYLSRIFVKQVGVSLSRYRNSLRLARFWELYRCPPQKTITEAVYAAGFGSYAQFYKIFVQAYGTGPRQSTNGA
jgi:AraC-like DNA-binding protein